MTIKIEIFFQAGRDHRLQHALRSSGSARF